MPLPAFNRDGDLPEGVHRATLAEVLVRFGTGTPPRQAASATLSQVQRLVRATGKLERFIIFGSYVTAKTAPNDVDIFLVMTKDFDVDQCTGETRTIFSHARFQRLRGASVFWVTRETSLANVEDLVTAWQMKRDHTKRGIVEVWQ